MVNLKDIIDDYYPLSPEAYQKIEAITQLIHLPKKTILFSPDRYEPDFYLISKGAARVYIVDENGNELSYLLFLEKAAPFPSKATCIKHRLMNTSICSKTQVFISLKQKN